MVGGAACFKKCENLTLHRFTISGNLGAGFHAPQRSVLLNYGRRRGLVPWVHRPIKRVDILVSEGQLKNK